MGHTPLQRHALTLILNLPDQPEGAFNPSHPQAFGGVTVVAMANGIDQGFMQPKG
jgi:hypothetical protein